VDGPTVCPSVELRLNPLHTEREAAATALGVAADLGLAGGIVGDRREFPGQVDLFPDWA
jgi:hypothetical protein